jgi:Domain of unknown function (DUF4783)
MKTLRNISVIVVGIMLIAIIAKADIFDDIGAALKSGNAHDVARYFDTSVELKTLDKNEVYSKNQAELVLKDFFDKNTPRNFTVIHRGSAKGARYAIGTMETNRGTFRTYVYIKDVAGSPSIQELTIEQQ